MKERSSRGCGSFLFTLLFVFVILKVSGAVDWSWWWVTSPLWLPVLAMLTGLALMAVMGVGIYKIVAAALGRRGPGRTGGFQTSPRDGSEGDAIDVEGAEVATSSPETKGRVGLPAPSGPDGVVEDTIKGREEV